MSLQHDRRKRVSGKPSAAERSDKAQVAAARRAPRPSDSRTARRAGAAKTSRIPPPAIAGVTLTHPERIVYADAGVTKCMVAEYYTRVATRLLPHVAGRPVSIVRCPDGAAKPCFYQKHAGNAAIPGMRNAMIEDGNGRHPYIVADTVKALAGFAQMNVLELHVWGARAATIERPDTMVLDLDPDPALTWVQVVAAARLTRALLEKLGLEAFVKTTGGKGLHLVVPLERRHGWDEVKGFAQRVAAHLARTLPDQFTATMGEKRRRGKIFVDYLRNARGATAVAPYSLRARPGATVATPLAWEELSSPVVPTQFTIATVPERIEREPDPWADYARRRQSITAAMQRALEG
jgi:bifunctional non-homologous end joining protein LigD